MFEMKKKGKQVTGKVTLIILQRYFYGFMVTRAGFFVIVVTGWLQCQSVRDTGGTTIHIVHGIHTFCI